MAEKPNTQKAAADDAGQAEVQAKFDEANEKGYFGESPLEVPQENYSLQGQLAGKPTPETHRDLK